MKHKVAGRALSRTSAHRSAMFKNMANSLIQHEVIQTTLPKAKELRIFFEPLITLAKTDSLANRRRAYQKLQDKDSVFKLFSYLGESFKDRNGGYTRILKCGFRKSDATPMAYVELVDKSAIYNAKAEARKEKLNKEAESLES